MRAAIAIVITATVAVGILAVTVDAVPSVYQAYCNVHPDWNNYAAGSGGDWGHRNQDWLGPCRSSEEAAVADAAIHDGKYHAYKAQYQAALETLGLPPGGKAKAGVKALPAVDCSPI